MKRRVAVRWMAFATGAALLPALAPNRPAVVSAQDAPSEVGAGPPGDASLRLVGRGEIGPDAVRLFGYLEGVIGLGSDLVFPSGAASEATAAFTWTAELPAATLDARGDVTTFSGDGEFDIHYNPVGGASWGDPASFAQGDVLAAYALSLATAVQRQSPTLGAVVGDGALVQQQAATFAVDGESFRFGHADAALRLRFTGALYGEGGAAGQPWPVGFTGAAAVLLPGSAPAARREATPPVATVDGAGSACAGWAAATRDRLRAAEADAAAVRSTPAEDLVVADLETAASAVAAALADQRAEPVEDADAATNRLAASALGTWERGLRALIAGFASGDDAAATAALQVIADGDALAARALADLIARYPECA